MASFRSEKDISGSIIQNSAKCLVVWLFSARKVGPKVYTSPRAHAWVSADSCAEGERQGGARPATGSGKPSRGVKRAPMARSAVFPGRDRGKSMSKNVPKASTTRGFLGDERTEELRVSQLMRCMITGGSKGQRARVASNQARTGYRACRHRARHHPGERAPGTTGRSRHHARSLDRRQDNKLASRAAFVPILLQYDSPKS